MTDQIANSIKDYIDTCESIAEVDVDQLQFIIDHALDFVNFGFLED